MDLTQRVLVQVLEAVAIYQSLQVVSYDHMCDIHMCQAMQLWLGLAKFTNILQSVRRRFILLILATISILSTLHDERLVFIKDCLNYAALPEQSTL